MPDQQSTLVHGTRKTAKLGKSPASFDLQSAAAQNVGAYSRYAKSMSLGVEQKQMSIFHVRSKNLKEI
jgi:hypothetical protein